MENITNRIEADFTGALEINNKCVENRAPGKMSEWVVTQSCPTLCNPMDCSLPGSSVPGMLQARILEWVAISSSRGLS